MRIYSGLTGRSIGKTYGLEEPGWNSLGGIGVVIGLGFVIRDIANAEAAARQEARAPKSGLKQGLLQ